jgi:hypothetical protein
VSEASFVVQAVTEVQLNMSVGRKNSLDITKVVQIDLLESNEAVSVRAEHRRDYDHATLSRRV